MDKSKIEAQVPHFFDWPAGSPKDTVTLTSCILFAQTIAQMAEDAQRERCAQQLEWLGYHELAHCLRTHLGFPENSGLNTGVNPRREVASA